jgi:hypothetical protein
MKALTLRPHWAWLVVNGYKDIENRSWPTQRRGRIWIHASSSRVTRSEYKRFLQVCQDQHINKFPAREDFKIAGIIGSVEIADCVTASRSYWFKGDYGFVLRNARTTLFRAMKGRLGFFDVDTDSSHAPNTKSQRGDFVAYHSTELMGHSYRSRRGEMRFLSKKPRAFLEKSIGCNVWVITGTRETGRNMIYRLAAVHIGTQVKDSDGVRVVVGKGGRVITPPVELNGRPWFNKLYREQNQFSFGFNGIRSAEVVAALHRLRSSAEARSS